MSHLDANEDKWSPSPVCGKPAVGNVAIKYDEVRESCVDEVCGWAYPLGHVVISLEAIKPVATQERLLLTTFEARQKSP